MSQPLREVSVGRTLSRASFTTLTETTVISGVTKRIPVTIGPSGTLIPFDPDASDGEYVFNVTSFLGLVFIII